MQGSYIQRPSNMSGLAGSQIGRPSGTLTNSQIGGRPSVNLASSQVGRPSVGSIGGMPLSHGVVSGGMPLSSGVVSGGMPLSHGVVSGGMPLSSGTLTSTGVGIGTGIGKGRVPVHGEIVTDETRM